MLITLFTHLIVSAITNHLFRRGILGAKYDVLKFFNCDALPSSDIIMETVPEIDTRKSDQKIQIKSSKKLDSDDNVKKNFRVQAKTEKDRLEFVGDSLLIEKINESSKINYRTNSFSNGSDFLR